MPKDSGSQTITNSGGFISDALSFAKNSKPGMLSWFDRLPEDARQTLKDLRDRFHGGELGDIQYRAMAVGIMRAAAERGWKTSGEQGVIAWLQKDR